MSKKFLRRLPLFSALSEEDLDQLYRFAETVTVPAGQVLMEEGSPGDAIYVVLDGSFEVSKRSGQQDVVLGVCEPGEVIGEMSLLEQAPRFASVCAVAEGRLLKIDQRAFERLLSQNPSAALAMLHTVTERLRSTEALLRENEKLAALGTLAAGLAHELNNPAAAVQRGVAQLSQALTEWQSLAVELEMALEPRHVGKLQTLHAALLERATAPPDLDPLTRSDREEVLQAWLEDVGVARAWELASTLLGQGWDVATLETLRSDLGRDPFPLLVRWLAAGSLIHTLLEEVSTGAARISETVKAVKTYAYLDQGPVQKVDVHEGLENTLVILRHKFKPGINLRREYAPDLPRIEGYGSELNQVWTNLIDNALDAMGEQGELTLRTYAEDGQVVVEIADDGPGIPPEVRARIFEPFFTTKPPGVGTGLGLHIVYTSIVRKHQGQVHVTSEPGATCFQVVLPVELEPR